MKRIDTPSRELDKHGPSRDGFTDGDPSSGIPPTNLTDSWFDHVQEEIAGVIESAGLTLDEADLGQLDRAIFQAARTFADGKKTFSADVDLNGTTTLRGDVNMESGGTFTSHLRIDSDNTILYRNGQKQFSRVLPAGMAQPYDLGSGPSWDLWWADLVVGGAGVWVSNSNRAALVFPVVLPQNSRITGATALVRMGEAYADEDDRMAIAIAEQVYDFSAPHALPSLSLVGGARSNQNNTSYHDLLTGLIDVPMNGNAEYSVRITASDNAGASPDRVAGVRLFYSCDRVEPTP